ncbi:MAG TPA: M1 family aminopeptidase [Bacteroidales bacterium]|nr:M1 family aminopeptidase [Bacteroidales bacterium]
MVVIIQHGQSLHNAPLFIARFMAIMSVFTLLFTVRMAGRSVAKDFQANIHDFYFTLPMSKTAYLGGRFFAGVTVNIIIYIGSLLGIIIGCLVIDDKYCGPHQLSAYLFTMFIILIPNIIIIGSLFFSLATLTRKMVSTYIISVAFLMIYFIVVVGIAGKSHETFKVLADPFGIGFLEVISKYWTIADINHNLVPLNKLIITNRVIWLSVSFIILVFTLRKFKFVSELESKEKKLSKEKEASEDRIAEVYDSIPSPAIDDSYVTQLQKCYNLFIIEFKRIVFHPAFILITILAMLQIIVNFTGHDVMESIKYPLTSTYLDQVKNIDLFLISLTLIFCGIVVWRERDCRSNELYDVIALPNWMTYFSKLISVVAMQLSVLILCILLGIFTQVVIYDYSKIELGLYIKSLVGIQLPGYFYLAVLFIFVQNLANNKYVGYLVCALLILIGTVVPQYIDSDISLFQYGTLPNYIYSNLNGYGHFATMLIWYHIYWLCMACVIVMITSILWCRSNETGLKFRIINAVNNFNRESRLSLTVLTILWLLTGCYIYYNNHVLNKFITGSEQKSKLATYEKKYRQYQNSPQPSVTHVNLRVDLYPEDRDVFIDGFFILKNNTHHIISDVYIGLSDRKITRINRFAFSSETELACEDKEHGFYIYHLQEPLSPGVEIRLDFGFEILTRGFSINNPKNELANNGTVITNFPLLPPEYLPQIGYNQYLELSNHYDREQYSLPARNQYFSLEDSIGLFTAVFRDLVTYEAVISTDKSQIAVTNGDLIKSWSENDRNYYHYKTGSPVNNNLVIQSGEYQVTKGAYEDLNIEVYYNKNHAYNIQRIMDGIKYSYDYCSLNFGPYAYKDIRVVEVPNCWAFLTGALSTPTNFSWCEDAGFIDNLQNESVPDNVFPIAAHEMAHQWWGYTVRPAAVKGSEFIVETMAMWVQIMCMRQEQGLEKTREYLKYEMSDYLRSRSSEMFEEQPLIYSEGQGYLSYRKGVIAMYALQDYIGEGAVNTALRTIVEKYGFKDAPYPTSLDLIEEFRSVTPDSLQYVIKDLFESIILYENRAESATYTKLANGKFRINLTISSQKFRVDGMGNPNEIQVNDNINIGVFGENNEVLYLTKHKIGKNKMTFDIIVDKKPVGAGIDPHFILIDRNPENNIVDVKAI